MDLSWLLAGLDPAGPEAMALCAAAAAALGALIGIGFVLLWRAGRRTRGDRRRVGSSGPTELGLLGLWRLNRAQVPNRTMCGGRDEPARAALHTN